MLPLHPQAHQAPTGALFTAVSPLRGGKQRWFLVVRFHAADALPPCLPCAACHWARHCASLSLDVGTIGHYQDGWKMARRACDIVRLELPRALVSYSCSASPYRVHFGGDALCGKWNATCIKHGTIIVADQGPSKKEVWPEMGASAWMLESTNYLGSAITKREMDGLTVSSL